MKTSTNSQKTNPSLSAHYDHMKSILGAKTMSDIVTVEELFGDSDATDNLIIMATRTFAMNYKALNLRACDIDAHVANVKRQTKAAAKAVINGGIVSSRTTEAYAWVSDMIDQLDISVDCAGNVFSITDPDMDTHSLLNTLILLNDEGPRRKSDVVKTAHREILIHRRRERLIELRDSVSGHHLTEPQADVLDSLTGLLEIGLDPSTPFTPSEACKMICKTIWQIKRKMWDIPVTRHTMLVFAGAQGAGKSEMVNALTRPMTEVTVSTDLRAITDDRNISLFNNFVGVIDELDKADRTSVESLKRVITDKTMSRRPMGTNAVMNIKQNLTFIGTTNRDVQEAIIDETGNRRFIQLDIIPPTHERRDAFWTAVSAFDWLALWRAVDEKADDPCIDIAQRITDTQLAERSRSFIELWIDHAIENSDSCVKLDAFQTTSDLFLDFKIWEESYNPKSFTSVARFSKEFARLTKQGVIPFEKKRTNLSNGYVCTAKPTNNI